MSLLHRHAALLCWLTVTVVLAAALLGLAACGSSSSGPATPTIAPARTFEIVGFRPSVPVRAGIATTISLTIQQPSGRPLTRFRRGSGPHTGVHLIIVRADLSRIVHLHPPIGPDGRITGTITLPDPGRYRVVLDVYPAVAGQRNFQLFRSIVVAGAYHPAKVPAFTPTVTVRGYTFTLHGRPKLHAISPGFLRITVRRPDGKAARFTPWFGALAHAIFFRAGSLDYFHTHVCGAGAAGCTSTLGSANVTGSSDVRGELRVGVLVPVEGTWRLFVQCRVDGHVLTAPFTLEVT